MEYSRMREWKRYASSGADGPTQSPGIACSSKTGPQIQEKKISLPLVSIPQLCDSDMDVHFTKTKVTVINATGKTQNSTFPIQYHPIRNWSNHEQTKNNFRHEWGRQRALRLAILVLLNQCE